MMGFGASNLKARLCGKALDFCGKAGVPFLLTVFCGVIVFCFFVVSFPTPDLMQADSPSYLAFSPKRTLGFPAFLVIVGHFDSSYRFLPFLQMSILILSAGALIEACNRLYPAAVTWLLTGLIVLINPFLWRYTMMLLTESIYASICMLIVAGFFMALRSRPRGAGWLVTSGILIGAAISIRPAAYAMLVAACIGTLFWKTRIVRSLISLAAPAFACVFALSLFNWAQNGVFGTQLAGGNEVIGSVALLIPPDLPGDDHEVAARIAADLKPISSRLPNSIREVRDYYWITYEALGYVREYKVMPRLVAEVLNRAQASHEDLNEI